MSKLWAYMVVIFLSGCMRPYYLDVINNSGSEIFIVRGDGYVISTIEAGSAGRVAYIPASRCLFIKSESSLNEYELTAPDINYFQGGRILYALYSPSLELFLFSNKERSEDKIVLKNTDCLGRLSKTN